MAGVIQTLILSPPSSKTLSFHHHRYPNFRPICNPYYTRSSTSFNPSRSISISTRIRACDRPDQVDGSGSGAAKFSSSSKGLALAKPLSNFVDKNFLPLALIGGVLLGLANPSLGCVADKWYLSKISTVGIFFISGLTLQNGEIGNAVKAWPVGLIGLLSILLFTPYFSKLILQIQLQPQEFVTGLAFFCCMPTTLSSGVALTQLAGGNAALALAMTVISNLLGILIIPFSISKFIAAGIGVSVPTKELLKSLVLMLLIPLIVGKVFRESSKDLADFVDKNRKLFSKMSAVFLSLAPWIQVSRSRPLLLMVKPEIFLVAIGMGVILHAFLIAFNALALQGLSIVSGGDQSVFAKKENASAFVLITSQKTLPVMVAVVEQLRGAFGETGLLVLPCVAAHLNQIIIDSFIVNFWLRKDQASKQAKLA